MASLNPRPDDPLAYPGEAGVETLAAPPFVAEDE